MTRRCLLSVLCVCLKAVSGVSSVDAFPLSRRAIMSATVRKAFLSHTEMKAQFPEQHQQQPGPEAFPLKPLAGLLCSVLRGLYRSLLLSVGSKSLCAWDILVLEPLGGKEIREMSAVLLQGYSCVLNCCALPVAACMGLQMRSSACEEKKISLYSAQQV